MRSRAETIGSPTSLNVRGSIKPAAKRRSKTPEHSRREQEDKNTIKGVAHAKARLIIDKRDAAENKPAQIIKKSTRSTSVAPPIWPIPSTSKTAPKKDTKPAKPVVPAKPKVSTPPKAQPTSAKELTSEEELDIDDTDPSYFNRSRKLARTPPK